MFICLNIIKIKIGMSFNINKLSFYILFAITFSLSAHDRNVAKDAVISASSSLNSETTPEKLADGIIGVKDFGEWVCEGVLTSWGYIELPWVKMEWDKPQQVNRIILYDRPSSIENSASVKLVFSDGSELYVRQIPGNGDGKEVLFETKTIEWV